MKGPEEFIERLKRSFYTPSSKDEKIKVVLICFVISTTFWFFSALNKQDYITQINYPIQLEYNEEQYLAVGELPNRIPIEVTGGGWDLMTRSFGLNMEPISIKLSRPADVSYVLSNSVRGQLAPNLDPVAINFILEDSIKFNIQKKVSRTVALQLNTESIDLEPDHLVDSEISLTPSLLTLSGPEELINAVPDTLVINLEESNIDQDFDQNVDIPELGDLIVSGVDRVSVSFKVDNLVTTDYDYPIQLMNAPDSSWEILPNYLPITVTMKSNSFDATDTLLFRLEVDFEKRTRDSLMGIEIKNLADHLLEYSIPLDSVKLFKNE